MAPVICGVAQSHLSAARTEISAAARLGAAAVLVAPPFYYPIDQPAVLNFYRHLAADSPLPILAYNIPQFTKVIFEPATLATLGREGVVAGVKDSSRDFEYHERVLIALRDLPDFRIFTGSDTMLLAAMAMGGAGTICGAANVAPGLVVRIFNAAAAGDWAAGRGDQDRLVDLVMALREGIYPASIKAACAIQGICEPWPAAPVVALDEAQTSRLRERLDLLLAAL
jgi:4-hydroxy-tetrahydrodipicolinate synthase